MFDLEHCDDLSVNIKFPSADQNRVKRRIVWLLHFSLMFLKLFELHARFFAYVFRMFVFVLFFVVFVVRNIIL